MRRTNAKKLQLKKQTLVRISEATGGMLTVNCPSRWQGCSDYDVCGGSQYLCTWYCSV